MKRIRISEIFPVKPEILYKAWLSSRKHSAFTGSKALIRAAEGTQFSAWDSYISGTNLELQPYSRIVQSWRTTDFKDSDPDSTLEITILPARSGSKLSLLHYGFPPDQQKAYEEGWELYYFEPMRAYFAGSGDR